MDFPSQGTFDPKLGRYYEGREVFSNRFVLHRLLGAGGMGQVWLAEDRHLGEEVALKFTVSEVAGDTKAVADLRRVVSQTRELTHPHIVRTYDFHVEGNEAAISMEFMPGNNLSEWQEKTPHGFFEPAEILPWIRTLCEVMDYAHKQAGRTHRDLKPKNLMWDAERAVLKVADFDIGRRITDTVSRNTGKEPSGSFPYMSPQQLLGERSVAQDDIYSIGATIYELLTGTPPFISGDVREQIRLIVPPSMGVRRRDNHHDGLIADTGKEIPPAWEKAVAACLSKAREKRPATGAGLLAMLEGRAVSTPKAPNPASSPASGKKKLLLAIGAFAVLGLATWAAMKGRDRPTGGLAGSGSVASTPPPVQPTPPPAPAPQFDSGSATSHTIARGESLYSISKKFGIALEAIMEANPGLDPRGMTVGQVIAIPAKAAGAAKTKGPAAATKEKPFENSLAMKFVPITTGGKKVLFSVWETRRKDYETYAKANSGVDDLWKNATWEGQPVGRQPDHPVVCVSPEEAAAFCAWLTNNERASGKIGQNDTYRLPTDAEWSVAVGIGDREDADATPKDKRMKLKDVYPWSGGKGVWPPPKGAGNYSGQETKGGFFGKMIDAYDDGYVTTSPVGSFPANANGLFDLGGNVWEFCQSYHDGKSGDCVARGGSWVNDDFDGLLSSSRFIDISVDSVNYFLGFRCVLVVSGP